MVRTLSRVPRLSIYCRSRAARPRARTASGESPARAATSLQAAAASARRPSASSAAARLVNVESSRFPAPSARSSSGERVGRPLRAQRDRAQPGAEPRLVGRRAGNRPAPPARARRRPARALAGAPSSSNSRSPSRRCHSQSGTGDAAGARLERQRRRSPPRRRRRTWRGSRARRSARQSAAAGGRRRARRRRGRPAPSAPDPTRRPAG